MPWVAPASVDASRAVLVGFRWCEVVAAGAVTVATVLRVAASATLPPSRAQLDTLPTTTTTEVPPVNLPELVPLSTAADACSLLTSAEAHVLSGKDEPGSLSSTGDNCQWQDAAHVDIFRAPEEQIFDLAASWPNFDGEKLLNPPGCPCVIGPAALVTIKYLQCLILRRDAEISLSAEVGVSHAELREICLEVASRV